MRSESKKNLKVTQFCTSIVYLNYICSFLTVPNITLQLVLFLYNLQIKKIDQLL